jgi:hypothetical protein
MSDIFSSIEGGSVSSFLAGDGSLPGDVVTPAPDTTEQAAASTADSRQVETAAPPQTDASVETPEASNDAVQEGTEQGSDKDASPDVQQSTEEFKEPKALRAAYDTLKAEVKPYEPYKDFIKSVVDQEISPVILTEAKSMFDSFVALDSIDEESAEYGAKTDEFLSGLYKLSPVAFNRAMMSLVDNNKELISKRLGVTATQESANVDDQEVPVPDFDPESGEPLSEEIKNLIRASNERVKNFNAKEKERKDADDAALAAQAQKDAEAQHRQIDQAIETYRNDRMAVIDRTIAKDLGLQDSPKDTPEMKADKALLREVIKGATVSAFGADPKAREHYKNAVDNIAQGKAKLADGLAFNIEQSMGNHAKRIVEFAMKLFADANSFRSGQVQKAADGEERKEISDTGASLNSGFVDTSNLVPFSDESLRARLANLEASGKLPRR